MLTDSEGVVSDTYDYDAFGIATASTGLTVNSYRYRGEYQDETTGLYYLRARYYDSTTGRFITADSYSGSISDPVSLHKYLYANGNPVMNSDPTGYFTLMEMSMAMNIQSSLQNSYNGAILNGLSSFLDALLGGEKDPAVLVSSFTTGVATGVLSSCLFGSLSAFGNMACTAPKLAMFGKLAVAGLSTVSVGATLGGALESFGEGKIAQGIFRMFNTACGAYGAAKAWGGARETHQNIKNGTACFVEGTPVLTEDGNKPIEDIEVGDYVYATDPETGESGYKEVVQTYVNETSELIHITIANEEIITTPTHPFYVPQRGWISAVNLRAGDILVLSNGEYVTIEKVQHEILEAPIKVYNFEVQDFHTYYVGKNSVLVHNMCEPELTRKQNDQIDMLRSGKDVYVSSIDEARDLIKGMPDISPPPLGRMNPEFSDPRGTYRGDLINKQNPMADFVHSPDKVVKHPTHAIYAHYNIFFNNGKKAAILIE